MTLSLFWCGVAVGGFFFFAGVAGWEWETRQRLREWADIESEEQRDKGER